MTIPMLSNSLQLAVCQLLHGLSRSAVLLHTLFSDVSIINCLIEVGLLSYSAYFEVLKFSSF